MRKREVRRFLSLISILVLALSSMDFSIAASAQTANSGVITGLVRDQAGAAVVDATVIAINKATGVSRTTKTSEAGAYELTQLVSGEYRVEVSQTGFARFVQEPVTVSVLSRITVNALLDPASITHQITIVADSGLIETTRTDVSGVVGKREMEHFPVNGRSLASLALLVPGASPQPSFDPVKARSGTFSIGGSTGRNVNITVDGGDNKDNHVGGTLQNYTMEGIQEFALATQRFSAANGRSSGALLSIVTKDGTNNLHGSVFGFARDDKFNANASAALANANPNLFEKEDITKLAFNRQQFGASMGGPIIKNRLFWFGALEHTRERGSAVVPSFAFNQIKELEPLGYEAVRFLPQPYDDTQYTVKGGFNPSPNHSLILRYAGQNNRSENDQAGFLTAFTDLSGGNKQSTGIHSLLGSWTWTINTRMVNQVLYQGSSFSNELVGISNLPNLSFPDGIVVGQNEHVPEHTLQQKHQFRDDFT